MEKSLYPPKYKEEKKRVKALEYDIGLLKLEKKVHIEYGYIGIDTREENAEGGKIEVCGYPHDKNSRKGPPTYEMWH